MHEGVWQVYGRCMKEADVIIVGAGLSGIGAACHLQRECPDRSFVILEARDAIGGTGVCYASPGCGTAAAWPPNA